ncbi:MAG TPA: efflux RND transporter periplasmic adaptor subunit [Steroidobacteraceae bacterium]|nr:efflux RND transporter periplasmic adaptor subunit [Steroidobacteraceae bacterium]
MDDKSKLIDVLRIDRGEHRESPPSSRWRLWSGVAAVVLLGGSIAAWLSWHGRSAPESAAVAAAETKPKTSDPAPPHSSASLDASGYVVARRKATVSGIINGRVVDVLINEGMRVQQGDVLARLDDGPYRLQLAEARAQLESSRAKLHGAEVALADAEPTLQRVRKQHAVGAVSPQALDDAKNGYDTISSNLEIERRAVALAETQVAIAARNLTDTVVRAPFSGVITDKIAQPGEVVSPAAAGGSIRTGIGTIVDMDSLEVEVDVSENFINRIHPGQSATARLNAYPEWEIPAEVIAVIPTADRSKATVKVRLAFKERDSRILPDMGVRVAFAR